MFHSTTEEGVSTGIIKFEDRLIIILDFEKIVTDAFAPSDAPFLFISSFTREEKITTGISFVSSSDLISFVSRCPSISYAENVELTVLCLIQQNDKYLLQNRLKDDWKGLTLPGGLIEKMNLS